MSSTVFTANRQLFFKGWPPCLNVQAYHLASVSPVKWVSVCFLYRNRTESGRPSTELPAQPSVSDHADIQNGDFSQPRAQGLAFRPPFFYQPAVPVVSKDKGPGLINN